MSSKAIKLLINILKPLGCVVVCVAVMYCVSLSIATPVFKDYADRYELYVNSNSSCANILSVNCSEYPFIQNIYGESCTINKDFDLKDFLFQMDAPILFTETLDTGVCYYAYSPKIKYKKSVNGKIVNLHVFIGQEHVKIGTPLIYGGY